MQTRERLSTIHRNIVVSYDKGELLGHVINVYFEKASCGIRGLSIIPKLIKTDRELFVSFQDIHRLGKNVVIVSSQSDLNKPPQKLKGSSLRDLKTIKVVTEDGEHLGELMDVNVFEKSGIISDILLYGSKKLKINVSKDKISIGPDMIIVPSGYQKRIEVLKNPEKKGFVANAEKTTRSVTESIKSAILSVATNKPNEADKATAKKKPGATAKKSGKSTTGSSPKSSAPPDQKKEGDKAPTTSKPVVTAKKASPTATGSSPKSSAPPDQKKTAKKKAKKAPKKKAAKKAVKKATKKAAGK